MATTTAITTLITPFSSSPDPTAVFYLTAGWKSTVYKRNMRSTIGKGWPLSSEIPGGEEHLPTILARSHFLSTWIPHYPYPHSDL